MNVLIASMSNLFLEAFQLGIKNRRPCWKVSIHLIQTLSFNSSLKQKIKEQCIDIVVIEITESQHFSLAIKSLKSLVEEDVNGVLLVDSKSGEVNHHLNNEDRWIGILKSMSLDEFTTSLELFVDNIPIASNIILSDMDKKVLKDLASGHTFQFIQHTNCLSVDEIEQIIYRINSYFNVSNYIESISKAIEQNILVI